VQIKHQGKRLSLFLNPTLAIEGKVYLNSGLWRRSIPTTSSSRQAISFPKSAGG
jgi:hypothetical protein